MEKFKVFILFVLLLTSQISLANKHCDNGGDVYSELFSYNQQQVDDQLKEISFIEQSLQSQVDWNGGESLLQNSLQQAQTKFPNTVIELKDGMPAAFWLGCCLGPIGLGIIIVNHESGEDIGKAVLGCVLPSTLFTLGVVTEDPFLIELAVEIFLSVFDSFH